MKPWRRIPAEQTAIVQEIRKQATAVGAAREQYDEAGQAEKIAAAELLDAVVDAVKPALGAMSNRVIVSWNGDTEEATSATFRALHLWGKSEPAHGMPAQGLLLSEHADLLLAKYSDGPNDSWSAEFELQTSRQVVDLVGKDLARIIEIIGLSLAAQARGAAARKTAAFVTRADRIRAAALLLRTA